MQIWHYMYLLLNENCNCIGLDFGAVKDKIKLSEQVSNLKLQRIFKSSSKI